MVLPPKVVLSTAHSSDMFVPSLKKTSWNCVIPSNWPLWKLWNVINTHNNEHLQRKNGEDYGCNTEYTDSQDDNVTVPSGSKLHNLPFLVLAMTFETSEYTFVYNKSLSQQKLLYVTYFT